MSFLTLTVPTSHFADLLPASAGPALFGQLSQSQREEEPITCANRWARMRPGRDNAEKTSGLFESSNLSDSSRVFSF
jgi:hypothetical protein